MWARQRAHQLNSWTTRRGFFLQVEGSFWGVNEFKANVLNLLESLQKSKREERAKEKMKKYERAPAMNRAKRREVDRLTK